MANTNAPFGFRQYFGGSGGAPTFSVGSYRIASTDTTKVFSGDVVQPVVSTATGYITQGTASTTVITGIFTGCTYLSVSQKRTVWNSYWPGADASGDVTAYVVDDPNAQFVVQGGSTTFNIGGTLTTWTTSPVGQYAMYTVGSGNTSTGQSGSYLSALGTTVTYPFIVRGLIDFPPGGPGADPLSAYNWVVVGFNDQLLRSNGAGPTGIS